MKRHLTVAFLAAIAAAAVAAPAASADADPCPNAALRAQSSSSHLPECRAYEMVTPSGKQGADAVWGLISNFAAADGKHFVWTSQPTLLGSNSGTGSQYEATRGDEGWQSRVMSLSQQVFHAIDYRGYFLDFACDGCSSLVGNSLDSADPADDDGGELGPWGESGPSLDVYRSDGVGAQEWISRGSIGGTKFAPASYGGRSADGSHIAFTTADRLEPEAQAVAPEATIAYERVNGQTRIVGRNDDGSVMTDGSFIAGAYPYHRSGVRRNTVSADGSRVFFASPASPEGVIPTHLYLREGDRTIDVSAPQCTRSGCGNGNVIAFEGASRDGAVAFFTSSQQLVDGDTDSAADVYAYEVGSGELTRVSGGETGTAITSEAGFALASDNGNRIYFWSTAALTAAPNARGEVPVEQAGTGRNFYVYDRKTETTTLIGVVNRLPDTNGLFQEQGLAKGIVATPDGGVVAFQSEADLLGPTGGASQIYRYDADADALACVSCRGGDAQGVATLYAGTRPIEEVRYRHNLSADGSRVFFATTAALSPADSNDVNDVYEWHDGTVSLLSAGTGRFESAMLDASADGSDVFIATWDRLTAGDDDHLMDVYDARIGGGIAAAPSVDGCAGDGCQGAPAPAPASATPASEAVAGAGNARAVRKQPKRKKRQKARRHNRGKHHAKANRNARNKDR